MTQRNGVEKNFKPGDIVLVGANSFISKSIQFFMKLRRRKLGLNVPKGLIASHAGTLVNLWDQLYIAEAAEKGIEVTPFMKAYGNRMEQIKVISPKKAYTKEEQEQISEVAIKDSLNPTRYDFFGLWYQMKKTLFGNWSGPTGDKAERRMYCTEAVATWANKVRPKTFDKEEAADPIDIEFNKYYKIIYDGSLIS